MARELRAARVGYSDDEMGHLRDDQESLGHGTSCLGPGSRANGRTGEFSCDPSRLCVLYRQSIHLSTIRLSSSSGTPLYLQLVEHLKHAIETGAIKPGEQLPSVRQMAEDLLINPNTVVRAYRELEGIVELRHGSGVFVCESVATRIDVMKRAEPIVRSAIDRLEMLDLDEGDIRRLVENDFALRRTAKQGRKRRA